MFFSGVISGKMYCCRCGWEGHLHPSAAGFALAAYVVTAIFVPFRDGERGSLGFPVVIIAEVESEGV